MSFCFFFFNDTATTEIYTLSLHDALPIWGPVAGQGQRLDHAARHLLAGEGRGGEPQRDAHVPDRQRAHPEGHRRSEEHTSELQSRQYLVCRLLLEKKNTK